MRLSFVSFFLKRFSGFFMLSAFLILTGGFPSSASERSNEDQAEVDDIDTLVLGEDYYVGVFVGSGDLNNRHTDLEGFANWGHSVHLLNMKKLIPLSVYWPVQGCTSMVCLSELKLMVPLEMIFQQVQTDLIQ